MRLDENGLGRFTYLEALSYMESIMGQPSASPYNKPRHVSMVRHDDGLYTVVALWDMISIASIVEYGGRDEGGYTLSHIHYAYRFPDSEYWRRQQIEASTY